MAKASTSTGGKQAAAGTVTQAQGQVVAINASGATCVLKPGDKVYPNDIIQTSEGGAVQIEFANGEKTVIGRDSALEVNELFKPTELTAAEDDAARIQAAILAGADPTQVAAASAAGNNAEDGRHGTVQVDFSINPNVTAGFGTSGVSGSDIKAGVQVGYDTNGGSSRLGGLERAAAQSANQTVILKLTADGGFTLAPIKQTIVENSNLTEVNALAGSTIPANATVTVNPPDPMPGGVKYDEATRNFELDPKSEVFDKMKEGDSQVVSVPYTVTVGTVTVPNNVTFTVTGSNDAPTVEARTGEGIEGGNVVSVSALAEASDAENDALSVVVPSPLPAGVTFDATTDSFSLDPTNATFESLAQGDTREVTVTYGVSDGVATTTNTVTFSVTGTNDAPTVKALTQTATEGGASVSVDALSKASDTDSEAVLNVVDVPSPLPAGVTYNAETKSFSLDPTNATFESLAQGATREVTVTYKVSDGDATVANTVTFTVTGTNDAPTVTALTQAATEGSSVVSVGALSGAADADGGTLSVDVPSPLPAGVTYNAETKSFSLDPSNATFESLAQGATREVQVTYNVSDGDATVANTVTFTVTGTNDAPTVSSLVQEAIEGGSAISVGALSNAADAEGDALSVDVPSPLPAGVTYNAETQSFSLDPANATFESLAQGATREVQVTYNVSDGDATVANTVTFTVTGTNDAPTVAALTQAATEGGSAVSVGALTGAADADGGTLSVDVPSPLPAGVTYNAETKSFSLDPSNAAFESLAQGATREVQVTYNVSDGDATVANTVTFTVTGTNDAPTIAALTQAATEGGSAVSVGALTGAADADGGTLSVDVPSPLPAGVTYNAETKSFSLDPANATFESLAQGATREVQVTYNVSDGDATVVNTVTFTVTGTNDAPTVAALTQVATEGGTTVSVDALSGAGDADGATLSVVAPGSLPDGVSFDATTNSFVLDPASATFNSLAAGATTQVSFSYGVSDGSATTSNTMTFTVTGTNDAPTVVAQKATATEGDSAVSVGALSGAADVDSGTVLSVVDVPSLPNGISYNAATQSFVVNPASAAFNSLAAGQTQTISLNYGVSDGTATTANTVTFTITGTNDAPTVMAQTAAATEDGSTVSVDALAGAGDVDAGASLSVVVPSNLPAGVSYNEATHSFVLDPSNAAYNDLAAGATTQVTLSYGVSDGTATTQNSVTFTVTGTNDAPVVVAQTASAIEGGSTVSVDALAGATDSDQNSGRGSNQGSNHGSNQGSGSNGQNDDGGDDRDSTLSVVVPPNLPAGVSYNTETHSFVLDPKNAAYNSLAQGATTKVVVSYGISDGDTTTNNTVTFTITGTNDAPTVVAQTATGIEGGSAVSVNALSGAADVDSGATLSVVNVPSLPDGVSYDAATQSFVVDPTNSSFNALAAGQSQTISLNYGVSDGATTTNNTVTFTITGTNDAPSVMAQTASGIEGGSVVSVGALTGAADVDSGAVLSVVNVPTLPAGVSYNEATQSFVINPASAAFNSLAAGQTQTISLNYGVSDGTATTANTVTFTITGTNDAPTVIAQTAAATEDGGSVSVSALFGAADVDSGAVLSVVVPSNLPAGVSYNEATQSFVLDPANAAYNDLAAGATTQVTFSYGVSDGTATTPNTVTFTVTGTNDAPVVIAQTASAIEGGQSVSVDALAGATDSDTSRGPKGNNGFGNGDQDAPGGSGGNNNAENSGSGTPVALSVVVPANLPVGVSYNAETHSFVLDPKNAVFDSLAQGATTQVVVSYGISDGDTTTNNTVTFTVTGTNDAPTVVAQSGSAVEGGSAVAVSALAGAADVDGAALSVVVPTNLPTGVSYNAETKSFVVDPANSSFNTLAAGQTQTITVNYGVSDGIATTANTVTFTVTGTNDAPTVVAQTGSANEGGNSVSFDALAGTQDADGNALSVVAPATLPAGVTYNAATHSFVLDPTHASFDSMAAGATKTVTVAYGVSDGATSTPTTMTFTVTGTNDAPVIATETVSFTTQLAGSTGTNGSAASWSAVELKAFNSGTAYESNGHFNPAAADTQVSYTSRGIGVVGSANGMPAPDQINHDAVTGKSQALAVDFKGDVATARVQVSNMFRNEEDGEQGHWVAYDANGNRVGEGMLSANTVTYVDNNVGTATVSLEGGASFRYLVFDAKPYADTADNPRSGDSSDFFVRSVSFDVATSKSAVIGSVIEDQSGKTTATGQLHATDVDQGATQAWSVVGGAGAYGNLSVDATGKWTYNLDHTKADSLGGGSSATETFTVRVSDGLGGVDDQTITVSIAGTNDAPVIAYTSASSAQEGSGVFAGRIAAASDVDTGDTLTYSLAANQSLPAGLTFNPDGTYTVNTNHADYNAMNQGTTLTYALSYQVSDGHGGVTTGNFQLAIAGTNDVPTITSSSGAVTEDTSLSIGGRVSVTDADASQSAVVAQAVAGTYGTFNIAADGQWTYQLGTATNVQALAGNEQRTETFTVLSQDRSASSTVTVTISGTNDAPSLTGTSASLVASLEDTSRIISATDLLAGFSDVDGGTLSISGLTADHGTVTINTNGTFTITPDANYFGPVALSYNVIDGQGGSTAATQSFTVTDVAEAGSGSGSSHGSNHGSGSGGSSHGSNSGGDDDRITGTSGNDVLSGGKGDDTISGGAGADILDGGKGDDTLMYSADGTWGSGVVAMNVGSPGSAGTNETFALNGDSRSFDVFRGGAGTDTVQLTGGNDAIFVDDGLSAAAASGSRINSIEIINAGAGNDVVDMTSTRYENLDEKGKVVNTTIDGGSGNDVLMAGGGNDTIVGGTGSDYLYGGKGNDILIGGQGDDVMLGGVGSDTFKYEAGDLAGTVSGDTIKDFQAGAGGDVLDLNDLLGNSGTLTFGNVSQNGDKTTVTLSVDTDGAGTAQGSVQVATITMTGIGAGATSADIMNQLLGDDQLKL